MVSILIRIGISRDSISCLLLITFFTFMQFHVENESFLFLFSDLQLAIRLAELAKKAGGALLMLPTPLPPFSKRRTFTHVALVLLCFPFWGLVCLGVLVLGPFWVLVGPGSFGGSPHQADHFRKF